MTANPQPSSNPATPPNARSALGLTFVLAAVTALGPFSNDMYLPAVPAMGQQLHTSPGAIQLTIAIFAIGSGLGQLVFGPISDRFGRRWPALIGLVVYIAASAGCALAINVEALIAFRFIQALGVCSGQIAARALLADLYGPRDLARLSSLLAMITMAAPIIGPLIGGYVFTGFGWRPLFWVLALYGALVLTLCALRLPETRTLEARARSREESALTSYLAVVRNRPLMRMGLASAAGMCGIFVYMGSAPHMLIEHYKIPPHQFGWYFAANAVGLFLGANLNRTLLKRREPGEVLRWSCICYFAATILIVIGAHMPQLGKFGVLVPLFLMVSSFPAVMGNSQAIAQGYDRQRGGAVAAVLGSLAMLLGATAMMVAAALSDGTPKAMAWTMATCAGLCVLLFYTSPRRRSKA